MPVRVEIGPRDLKEGVVSVVRRDNGEKAAVPVDGVAAAVRDALDAAQAALAEESRSQTESRTKDVSSVDEAIEAAADGFARLPWDACGPEGEAKLNEHAVSIRCLQTADGGLPDDPDAPGLTAIAGRAY